MPAVARYDYELHDYHEDGEQDESADKREEVTSIAKSGITMTSSNDGNTPRFLGNNYRISGGGPSGPTGGGERPPHRCPKCGASVTFQESSTGTGASGNRIQNCFYCAACSGWFLVQPESFVSGEEHSKYLLSKLSSAEGGAGEKKEMGIPTNRKISEPQFVMQDVSCMVLLFVLLL